MYIYIYSAESSPDKEEITVSKRLTPMTPIHTPWPTAQCIYTKSTELSVAPHTRTHKHLFFTPSFFPLFSDAHCPSLEETKAARAGGANGFQEAAINHQMLTDYLNSQWNLFHVSDKHRSASGRPLAEICPHLIYQSIYRSYKSQPLSIRRTSATENLNRSSPVASA